MYPSRTLFVLALLCLSVAVCPAKPSWQPVPPEELAEKAPLLEPEAPAEALLIQVEVDDSDFPRERRITEYIRYKIFRPDKVESITRISGFETNLSDNQTELRARLLQQDGRIQEFGRESIKERALARTGKESGFLGWLVGGGFEVTERFLAVSGIEAGSVLEYQIARTVNYPGAVDFYGLQREGIPVRRGTYRCKLTRNKDTWQNRTFVLNAKGAKLSEDAKQRTVTIDASNLPSVVREPLMGPLTDRAMMIVSHYEPTTLYLSPRSGKVPLPGIVDAKPGPWAPFATMMNWYERDRGWITPRVRELAAEITAGLTEPEAKARAIHARVQGLHRKSNEATGPRVIARTMPQSLDDVIEVEKQPEVARPAEEFIWLAVALCQSAGLEAHAVMLPDLSYFRFNPTSPSPVFLPNRAVAIKLGERWVFSAPNTRNRLSFGLLPCEQEGQQGLLAMERQQVFVPVPATPAEKSVVNSIGKFALDAEGNLTGECMRNFTGHAAAALRGDLSRAKTEARFEMASRRFGFDTKQVEVTVTKVEGLEDSEKPLLLAAKIRWNGYATRTKNRLLVRAAVFHVEDASPFTATERRYAVHFPFRWLENDRIQITFPEGFSPETPTSPAPLPGATLHYEMRLKYDSAHNTLHAGRVTRVNTVDVAPQYYPVLKQWYDQVSRNDQHEVVIRRTGEAPAAVPPAAAKQDT